MSVSSTEFLLGLLLISAVFHHLAGIRMQQVLLALCNAGFLYLLIPNSASWMVLAVFLLSGYSVSIWLRTNPNRVLFGAYLVLLVAAFVYLKKYDFLKVALSGDILSHPITIVGLSYMLFRQIHFIVDAMQGQIKSLSLWAYLNYQLLSFTLIAGPIQRFQEFKHYWDQPRPLLTDRYELLKTYLRVLMGIIKVVVLAEVFLTICEEGNRLFPFLHGAPRILYPGLVWFYFYPIYVYFNFSGYCDIVIGGAFLLGLRLPENFDRPYLARNMIDFWMRWHRTLTFWIRDYLFTPIYKSIAETWPRRANSLVFLVYFVALLVAGVWHGSTLNFIFFGLMHGIGVSTAKLWEDFLIKRYGRSGLKKYIHSRRNRIIANVLTFHFTCAAFLFFPVQLFHRTARQATSLFFS